MTDTNQHIDVDSEEFESAPRALRDAYKRLQKQTADLIAERDGFRNQITENALGDVLAGFKNPGRVKSDLLSDGVDPLDSEAVKTWMESNGDDYARAQAPADPAAEEVPNEEIPDYARLNGVAEIGTPAGAAKSHLLAQIPDGLNAQQTREWLLKQGF